MAISSPDFLRDVFNPRFLSLGKTDILGCCGGPTVLRDPLAHCCVMLRVYSRVLFVQGVF